MTPKYHQDQIVYCRGLHYHGIVRAVWFDANETEYRYVVETQIGRMLMLPYERELMLSKGTIVIPGSSGKG